MSDPDLATWLTKQQAADALGVSTKTIESLAKDGKLQQARWRRPEGGPALAVFHPAEVHQMAQARRGTGGTAYVVPDPAVAPANGNGHAVEALTITVPPAPADLDPMVVWATAWLTAWTARTSQTSATSQTSQKSPTIYLTLRAAAAFTGLRPKFLKRMIDQGTLSAIQDGRVWKVRKKDLEAL